MPCCYCSKLLKGIKYRMRKLFSSYKYSYSKLKGKCISAIYFFPATTKKYTQELRQYNEKNNEVLGL